MFSSGPRARNQASEKNFVGVPTESSGWAAISETLRERASGTRYLIAQWSTGDYDNLEEGELLPNTTAAFVFPATVDLVIYYLIEDLGTFCYHKFFRDPRLAFVWPTAPSSLSHVRRKAALLDHLSCVRDKFTSGPPEILCVLQDYFLTPVCQFHVVRTSSNNLPAIMPSAPICLPVLGDDVTWEFAAHGPDMWQWFPNQQDSLFFGVHDPRGNCLCGGPWQEPEAKAGYKGLIAG